MTLMCKWRVLYDGYWISTVIDQRDMTQDALRALFVGSHPPGTYEAARLTFAVVAASEMMVPS